MMRNYKFVSEKLANSRLTPLSEALTRNIRALNE